MENENRLERLGMCYNLKEGDACRLLYPALDGWIQALAGQERLRPDVEGYVKAVAEQIAPRRRKRSAAERAAPYAELFAYDTRPLRHHAHLTALRAYLCAVCGHTDVGALWLRAFPAYFEESRPAFETVFLFGLLSRRPYEGEWQLTVDARRCLCLCGYQFILRLPPQPFDWSQPAIEALMARLVVRTAIEDRVFMYPEQAAPFRHALAAYRRVEDPAMLGPLLYPQTAYWGQRIAQDEERDAAFRAVLTGEE